MRRSLRDGKIFDQPQQPVQRYQVEKKKAEYFGWRFNNKVRSMPQGKKLRLILLDAATVHWTFDGWQTTNDIHSRDTRLGVYVVDLPTESLRSGQVIEFTFFWQQTQTWEGNNYSVMVE